MKKILIVAILCLLGTSAFSQKDKHVLLDKGPYNYIAPEDSFYYDDFIYDVYTAIGFRDCCDTIDGVLTYHTEYIFREEVGIFPYQYSLGGGFNPPLINMGDVYRDMLRGDTKYFADKIKRKLKRIYGLKLKKFSRSCYDFEPVIMSIDREDDMLLFAVDFHFTIYFQK